MRGSFRTSNGCSRLWPSTSSRTRYDPGVTTIAALPGGPAASAWYRSQAKRLAPASAGTPSAPENRRISLPCESRNVSDTSPLGRSFRE